MPCADSGIRQTSRVALAARLVVAPDGEQAGELALGTGVRLQGAGVIAGDRAQPRLQVADQLEVAGRVPGRRQRVQPGELRPGDGLHLGRRVQLHRAGPEGDHRPVERHVEVGQPPQVAEHRGLAAVRAEHRVGQELGGADQRRRDGVLVRRDQRHVAAVQAAADAGGADEGGDHVAQVRRGGRLVARDLHHAVARVVQVVAGLRGAPHGAARLGRPRQQDPDGVEGDATSRSETVGTDGGGEGSGAAMSTPRDRGQAIGPVVAGVHAGRHGEQHLGGADVAGGLLAADVLLARLQRQPVGGVAVGVHRDAHEAAGQLPAQVLADGHVGGVRPAEEHRHAEPLRGADRHVGAQLARGLEQRQRQNVGGHGYRRLSGVGGLDHGGEVADFSGRAGILQQDAEGPVEGPVEGTAEVRLRGERSDAKVDAERQRAGAQHVQGLREAVRVGEEDVARLRPGNPAGERHRLRGGAGLVEQGGVGDRQPGQVGDHRLEVEQRLEAALRDLRLVRRVGRVPGGVLQQVAPDHRRRDRAVVALPDHGHPDGVAGGDPPQLREGLLLGPRGGQRRQRRGRPGSRRERGGGQVVKGGVAERGEHGLLVVGRRADVTGREQITSGENGRIGGQWSLPDQGSPSVADPAPESPVPPGPWCLRGSGEDCCPFGAVVRRAPTVSPSRDNWL